MRRSYLAFLRGLAASRLSRAGAALATTMIVTFVVFELLRIIGLIANAYIGLITYLAFPALFVIGLLLIPLDWFLESRRCGCSVRALLRRRFDSHLLEPGETGSRLLRTVGTLTLINVIFFGAVGMRTVHFMDQSAFCGTACHKVMNPEWTTYQASPHARVRCVDCHVGEGPKAVVDAKLNGLWQVISATFDLYERPIPTPVHNLRPARETCEKCHWPEIFHGDRVVNRERFALDSANTPRYTTLMMKIGSGQETLAQGSHWHVAAANEVRYASVDDERRDMLWVDARQRDGSFMRFRNNALADERSGAQEYIRTMDCVDCHNRATHIYEYPEPAVDDRIRLGLIDRSLPYIKTRALGALTNNYPDSTVAMRAIDAHLRGFYRAQFPRLLSTRGAAIDSAVAAVQAIYRRNIHPQMNITWGSYPDHLGHQTSAGCFRCHNPALVNDAGKSISMDCTLCHSILANDEDEPYKYLFMPDDSTAGPNRDMARYLRDEFWQATHRRQR